MSKWLLPASVVALLACGAQARASVVTYDFEDAALGAATPLSLTEQGLQANFSGSSDPDAFEVSYSVAGTLPATYATFTGAFLTVGSTFGAAGSALTISFARAIHSLSLLFALDDPSSATRLSATTDTGLAGSATGTLRTGYSYPEGRLTVAGGWFDSVTLSSDALDFSIDTVVVDTPEPASLLLTLGALTALTATRRRAKR